MKPIIKVLIYAAAVCLLITVVFAILIYAFGVDNRATRVFNAAVPILPAAIVGGRVVLLSEVDERLALYERAALYQSAGARVERNLVESQILDKLIREQIVSILLGKARFSERTPSLTEYASFVSSAFNVSARDALGMSDREFKENIIKPDFQQKTLQVYFLLGQQNTPVYEKAKMVSTQLAVGQEFAVAARLYSEDEDSRYLGGDLGFFTKGDINPWFGEAVFGLSPSSTSDILAAPDGYHIARVASRDPGPPERVQLQHILIRGTGFDEYLQKRESYFRVYKFVNF